MSTPSTGRAPRAGRELPGTEVRARGVVAPAVVEPGVVRGVAVRVAVLRVVVLRDRVVWLIARGEIGLAPSTHSCPQLVQRIMLRPSSAIPRYSAADCSHVGHASAIPLPAVRVIGVGAHPRPAGAGPSGCAGSRRR